MPGFHRSFRFRLALSSGGMALLLAVAATLYVQHFASSRITHSSGERLVGVAFSVSNTLAEGVIQRAREIELLSRSPVLVKGDWRGDDVRGLFDAVKSTYRPYAWLGLADAEGVVVTAADGLLEGVRVAERPWFRGGMHNTFVGDVHEAKLLADKLRAPGGEPLRFVDFAAPVRTSDGTVMGVVATHLDWNWVAAVVADVHSGIDVERGVEVFVSGRDAQVLYPHGYFGETGIAPELLPGGEHGVVTWDDGETYLVARSPVDGPYVSDLQWEIVVRQPVSHALAAVDDLRWRLFLLSVPVVLLFMLVAWHFATRFSRPVEELARVAQAIDAGSEDARFSQRSGISELSHLAASLSGMTATLMRRREDLLQANEMLESKVADRTAALEEATRKLEARFERSLEFARAGAWEWDVDQGTVRCSRQVADLLGWDIVPISVEQASFYASIHPDDLHLVMAALERCVADEGPFDVEYRVSHSGGGKARWVHAFGDRQPSDEAPGVRIFGILHDVTERVSIEKALWESANRTRAVLDNVVDAIITIDEAGSILSFNPAATRVFGYGPSEVIGRNVKMLMPEPYRSEHDGYIRAHRETGVNKIIGIGREVVGLRSNGVEFPLNLAVSKVELDEGCMYIGLIRDISAQREAEEEIRRLAFFDPLTGLPNRRNLLDQVSDAMRHCESRGQRGGVILLDIDDFKTLNDTLGHRLGDELLVQIAHRLQDVVAGHGVVARLSADEFVLLLHGIGPDCAAAHDALCTIVKAAFAAIRKPFALSSKDYLASVCAGVTDFGGAEEASADSVLGRADIALHQAKLRGRGHFRFFDLELEQALHERASLAEDLSAALGSDELRVAYQPQVDPEGRVFGCEALLRWRHPVRGEVSPALFVPLAEESGRILELGHWVLRQACLLLAEWATDPLRAGIKISVNVSARQFRSQDFVAEVLGVLQATGAPANCLKLELTESAFVEDVPDLVGKMNALKEVGVTFSLDDFGTGYSSLSYVRKLPLDQLKIDQSFVRDVVSNPDDQAIVQTIISLGQALQLPVIAEGVETGEERDFLLQAGCSRYQGYFYAKPMFRDALEAYLDQAPHEAKEA